jgi:hypothetical protein
MIFLERISFIKIQKNGFKMLAIYRHILFGLYLAL